VSAGTADVSPPLIRAGPGGLFEEFLLRSRPDAAAKFSKISSVKRKPFTFSGGSSRQFPLLISPEKNAVRYAVFFNRGTLRSHSSRTRTYAAIHWRSGRAAEILSRIFSNDPWLIE